MNKIISLILLCFISYSFQAQELSVDLMDQQTDLVPGKVQSLVFKITNPYSHALTFTPKTTLPEGWTLIAQPLELIIPAQESKIYIASIEVPLYASNKEYEISFAIHDILNALNYEKSFTLIVEKKQKISLNIISSSAYVKAGDTIQSSFILKNEGNENEKVHLSVLKGTFVKQESPILLSPNTSTIIEVYQPTDIKQSRISQNLIKLTANLENDSIPQIHVSRHVEVIPVFQENEDIWLRFPIKVAASYIGAQKSNEFKSGFQGEIYGKGNLTEKENKKQQLEFRAIGPDQFNLTSFSQYEEYFINYETKDFFVHLGDKVYSSSTLTEFARYGRGAEVRKDFQKLELGGFYNSPRFFKDIKDEFNLYAKVNFNSKNNVRYGFLLKRQEEKSTESQLHYLAGETNLFKKVDVKGEYAISNQDKTHGNAWYLQAQSYLNKLNFFASYIHASPTFTGYYTNTNFFTANIGYKVLPKLNVSVNYQKDARNFEKDTLFGMAPYRERLQIGARYNYLKKGAISFFHGSQEYEDRMANKQFFYKETFNRIEIQQDINDFSFNLQAYFAKTKNFLLQSTNNSFMYTANFNYNYKGNYLSLYGSYSKTNRYKIQDEESFLYGARINATLFKKLDASVFYQNTYYLEEYFRDRNLFELALHYRLTPKQQIDVISRYALPQREVDNRDLSFSVRYTLNINVPIKKVKEYGSLHGNITNLGDTEIEGIKVYLGSRMAITDEKGNFVFKNIKPDTYFLEIGQETLKIDDITDVIVPMKVEILEGVNYIGLGLTKAATIKGTIVLNTPPVDDSKQSVIIEISSDTEVFRKICDLNKPFDFTYLRPGNWHLKVYRNGLDPMYKILTDDLSFTLNPKEEKEIRININTIEKEIKYLQEPIKVGFSTSKEKK